MPLPDRRAPVDPLELIEQARAGDLRSRAKLFSLVEDGGSDAAQVLEILSPQAGRALVVGLTGPPGAGKSTLVALLARAIRESGQTVAILAVDPSSPITGGALLGDRIRMQNLHGDRGAYVRSISTRGATGGLARAVGDMVVLADALGYDVVIVETVGAGQNEADVAGIAPTVVVVVAPQLGDDVQSIKAGILEIASIFVVNKSDLDCADQAASHLHSMLSLAHGRDGWRPPVLKTSALTGSGVDRLLEAIHRHHRFLETSGRLTAWPIERARQVLLEGARTRILTSILESFDPAEFARLVSDLAGHRITLQTGIDRLLEMRDGVSPP